MSAVQTVLSSANWHHVPTDENPADLASRGINANLLVNSDLWWRGPQFIRSEPLVLPHSADTPADIPDVAKPKVVSASAQVEEHLIEIKRFSSLSRLQRAFTLVHKLCLGKKSSRPLSTITSSEVNLAFKKLLARDQLVHFPVEFQTLQNNKLLPVSSSLRPLAPLVDGLLRVVG